MRKYINKLSNIFVKPILKSPLHFIMSGNFMLITFTGRKSGKVYTTPVMYMRDREMVTFFSTASYVWWKNLKDGAQVTLRLKGRDVPGKTHEISQDPETIADGYRRMYKRMTTEQAQELSQTSVMIKIALTAA